MIAAQSLPTGWEGVPPEAPIVDLPTFAAHVRFVLNIIHVARTVSVGREINNPSRHVRNAYLALQELGVPNRPTWEPGQRTTDQAVAELERLLAWAETTAAEKREAPTPAVAPEGEKREAPASAIVQSEATPAAMPGNDPTLAFMRVFTNGIADDRIEEATRLLGDNTLTVNEKLTKIDALIPFPATASAEELGEMLGVTKQAVWKTEWWIQNRKGEKKNEIGRRREGHRKRAKDYELPGRDDDDE